VRLAFVDLCGFRGYRKPVRIDFAERFTIIDGRNGVGKSTIFDAIEFALTGTLGKYDDATAAGETIADYLWWTGEGPAPEQRYVEVGFRSGEEETSIRRTQIGAPDAERLARITARLSDPHLAPLEPLRQLCTTAIIRDERITALSLDLKETDRYALLRDALGANDSELWISRGAELVTLAKRRTAAAQQEVTAANGKVATAARRIDEVRANLVGEAAIGQAVSRLRAFVDTQVSPDQLASPVRQRIAALSAEVEALEDLSSRWSRVETERLRLGELSDAVSAANAERDAAAAALQQGMTTHEPVSASSMAAGARDLITLVTLGRQIGLRDGHCPLCGSGKSHEEYERGLTAAERLARALDDQGARVAMHEQAQRTLEGRFTSAEQAAGAAESARLSVVRVVQEFDQERRARGVAAGTGDQIAARAASLRQSLDAARKDLRILETLHLSGELERAQRSESDAKNRLLRAQERFGRARKAEVTAQALHDAARRAAAETLDRRLERVLPLMSELYRRLRPHPVWSDIEYSIRGDVRRFLKLQVGEELNPQFLFSSGQRRATGLAFLLSVNLSLAWSRWESILLDDPVQHIDDFRAIHLAEVAAQLVSDGCQIICAVEDAALADLLCRRLPIDRIGQAKRITLGPDTEGALGKLSERTLTPLLRNSLLAAPGQSAVS